MSEFERWETRFSADHYVFGKEPNHFLRAHTELFTPGQRALSVADGEGRNGVWMARHGLKVHAVDFSPNALAKSKALAEEHGVEIETECVDLLHWDWPDAEYDMVVGIFIQFTGPDDRASMFAGMKKALKPGGLLLLEGYRPKQLEYATGGPGKLENLYTRELLESQFGDFEILSIDEYDTEVDEGPGHSGMSALIDLIARKPV